MTSDFSPEQKRYLEGFMSGLQAMRAGTPAQSTNLAASNGGPDKAHLDAQDAVTARGGKLTDQEKWKRAGHPFDAWARFRKQAASGGYPKPDDNFRWRYHGLFYVAPAQDSYMCRMRIPNGILTHWQFSAVADIADRLAGGYAHVTTRANIQIREIRAENAPEVLDALANVGVTAKGSGADNIRNVTGSATAGIDPQERCDTRPYANAWHHHILNDRSLYGLPRKFNVAFDGGGRIATLEDTNDIGFQAVRVPEGENAGIYYRLALGGITGHRDLARDTGVLVPLDEAVEVADAIVRVFIAHGDRTNRNRARLKYLLDAWGFEKFLHEVEVILGRSLLRVDAAEIAPRPLHDRLAHIGVHAQKQKGLNWIGVWTPLGRLTVTQMRALAETARMFGDGDIRLTVWQNLLMSGVTDDNVESAIAAIEACGLSVSVSMARAGLVACTGNKGCRFAASDTKGHALQIADHLDQTIALDLPVNIHLTGCHNSCAQHYIGDVGLIGAKVPTGAGDDVVEGYHLCVGGGFGQNGAIGRQILDNVVASEAPHRVEAILRAWQALRVNESESFQAFTARHDVETLRRFAEGGS